MSAGEFVQGYKWTDADVREGGEELRDVALHWLDCYYCGEFEPLVKIRQHLAAGKTITVVMIRTILNCMRGDSHGADMLEAYSKVETNGIPSRRRDHLRVVPDPPVPARKAMVQLKHHWNKRYLVGATKQAKNAHIIRGSKSYFQWCLYPEPHYSASVHTWCQFYKSTDTWLKNGVTEFRFTGIMIDDPEDYGFGLCMTCIRNLASAEEE